MKHIPNGLTRQLARQILIVRKNSPQLMFVGGIVGVGASTVMACRSTLQLSDQLDKMKSELTAVRELRDDPQNETSDRDVAYIYAKNAGKVARLYAPAALVGIASIGALTGAHVTLQRRNVGLTAAYASIAKAYDEYRDRVKDEVGEEKENDLYHAVSTEKVKGEDNKLHDHKVIDPNSGSPYARFYDESSRNWEKSAQYNLMFVEVQQKHMNDRLKAYGHVFLNEVYDALGFPRTKEGAIVGWIFNPDDPERDNYIDFGLHNTRNADFNAGLDRNAHLDFNVDGVIYNLI